LQDPPKFTQIEIFGLKTSHLATLLQRRQFVFMSFAPEARKWLLLNARALFSITFYGPVDSFYCDGVAVRLWSSPTPA
jgi:hypothetical protein